MTPESESQDLRPHRGTGGENLPPPAEDALDFGLDLLPVEETGIDTSLGGLRSDGPRHTEVAAVFQSLDKAIRARRLYQANNPVYHGFLKTLREAFAALWSVTTVLQLEVDEHGFRWNDHLYAVGEGRDNLAFLFYKDGIRHLTLLPTFEEELDEFLDTVHRARQLDSGEDDLVTLLWEKEFTALQYSYVDALAEGLEIPDMIPTRQVDAIEPQAIQADVSSTPPDLEQPYAVQQGAPPVAGLINREDFNETLYFLDFEELEQLKAEIDREWNRDLRTDILNALFDRLEDPMAERQSEILRILRQLLPAFLARGDLGSASKVLVELSAVLEQNTFAEEQAREAQRIFDELSEPAALSQLLRSLEEGAIDPAGSELGVFLRHLGPQSLALLIRATETTSVNALQGRLRAATEGLAREHPDQLVQLIRSEDDTIAGGAARLAGQAALANAAGAISALLKRPLASVRRVAVEALIQLRSAPAMEGVQQALEDADRDVRIAAARGLAALRYQPARARLETLIQSSRMKDADLTEKIAFFEAFGAVANAESVEMLDRLLNGRNLLRQKQSPEIRACAAMALGRVGTPASRESLQRAADETHPMVRNAIMKALRQEKSS